MRIRHTLLRALLPPVVLMAIALGSLHWRSAVETRRGMADVLAQLPEDHRAYALQRFETVQRTSTWRFVSAAAAATCVFLMLAGLLARRFARPLAALTRAVEHAPETAPVAPIALRASGEIGQLARAFQDLRTRLAASALEAGRHERLLEETTRNLDEAQRVSGVGSWTYDLHTHRVTWSNQQYRLFGLSPGEIEPSYEAFVEAVHPDDRAMAVAIVNRTIEASSAFAFDYRVIRNGETRILHARAQVGDGLTRKASVLGGTSQDVTELREAEAAIKTNVERFELAARATHDSLWDWDIVNDRLWRNKAFYDTFRYGSADPGMVPCRTALIHPDDAPRVERSLQGFLASDREGWACEYRFRRADASYVWILDRGFVVRDASGAPTRMIGSMMNVTARKEADRMTSDFVAFASHQLRTPLTGINWMLELALGVPDLPAAARRHVLDAEASGQRLVSLVNDLLDVSRLESSQLPMTMERIELESLTRSVVQELGQSFADKQHLVVFDLNGGAVVTADVQLLRQAIMNLLANAIAYTPAGQAITVAMASHHGAVRWSVTDSGIGVPHEAKGRLFEKFFRAGNAITLIPEGTGLGLHLVRLIIQQSGGTVWCDSAGEGQGATFTFEIPSLEAA